SPDYDGNYTVNWNDVDNATIYYLFRATSPITNVSGMTQIYSGANSQYDEINIAPNTYYYAVIASNMYYNTSLSENKSVAVQYPSVAPVIDPIASPDYDGNYTINWNDVDNATIYYLFRATSPITDVSDMTPIYSGANSQYDEINIAPNTYYYAVIASNSEKNSTISINISINVNYPIQQPIFKEYNVKDFDGNYLIEWYNVENATIYYLFRSSNPILDVSSMTPLYIGGASNFTESNMPLGTYYYVLIASNLYVNTSLSNNCIVNISYPTQIPIISSIESPDYDGNYIVNWTDAENATIYYLFRDIKTIYNVDSLTPIYIGTESNFTEQSVYPNLYYYAVIAGTSEMNLSLSENIFVDVRYPAEVPYIFIQFSESNHTYRLTWNLIKYATYYILYRSNHPITSLEGLEPIYNGTNLYYDEKDMEDGIYYYIIVASNGYVNSYTLESTIVIVRAFEMFIKRIMYIIIASIGALAFGIIMLKRRKRSPDIMNKLLNEKQALYQEIQDYIVDDNHYLIPDYDPNLSFKILDSKKLNLLKQIGFDDDYIDLTTEKRKILQEIREDAAGMSIDEIKAIIDYIKDEISNKD
ncbi:MAG: hypothetical protein ACTSO2_18045, partial [Promethearchaeota archaeon]